MKKFLIASMAFWFVLLLLAFVNAAIRETTYKPVLTPYLGIWAHQISSLTGILLFFSAIFVYLKCIKYRYTRFELFVVSVIWIVMTIMFESFMNISIRKLTYWQVMETYYFWKGETWIFVLLSLVVSPQLIYTSAVKNNAPA